MTGICPEFANLTPGYQDHAAVQHLSGLGECGLLTAVVEANGSGKSNLIKGYRRHLPPDQRRLRRHEAARLPPSNGAGQGRDELPLKSKRSSGLSRSSTREDCA
jgi:energy-coupling factor transporter ATP-binding protein EcfA2